MDSSAMPPPLRAPHSQARRYSPGEWEAQKPRIEELYVKEQRTLKESMDMLKDECGFVASEKQLKSKITKWGFDVKNVKGDTMIRMARTQAKRKRMENKESAFRVNKKPVDERKISRYVRRNDYSQEDLLSMPSPVDASSPVFSVYTPVPPSPDNQFLALSRIQTPAPTSTNLFEAQIYQSPKVSHSIQLFNYFDFFEDHAPPSSLELVLHHTSRSASPDPTHPDLAAGTGNLHWGSLHPEFLFGKGVNNFAMEVFDTTTDTNAGTDFEPAATGHIIPTPGSPGSPRQSNEELEGVPRPRTSDVELMVRADNSKQMPTNFSHAVFRKPNLYETIHAHENDPEMLMRRFDEQVCGILSIKDGPTENPWRTVVLPLARDSPALVHAIAALTAFHASKEKPHFRVDGLEHKRRSIRSLATGIEKMRPSIALATTLLLMFAESWDQHISTGIEHLRAARFLLEEAMLQLRNQIVSNEKREDLELLEFLDNTLIYRDVLARIVCPWMESESYHTGSVYEQHQEGFRPLRPRNNEIDPLMGAATTLFPQIKRVANLCARVRNTAVTSTFDIQDAIALKGMIEQWSPDGPYESPEDPMCPVVYALRMAEAYRYATLLYLHQAVPEIPSLTSVLLADRVLVYLAMIPLFSRVTVVQIYPLLMAGCEAHTKEDRELVVNRWKAMANRMHIGNIDRCLEITQEVWRRRDSFFKTRRAVGIVPYEQLRFRGREIISEIMDPEMTVRGKLHWAGVMKDWNWEVVL